MAGKVIIIDYDMGNIRSIQNRIHRSGYQTVVTNDIRIIDQAWKLILPGVGHFANGMKKLKEKGLIETLNNKVIIKKTPILGICLGMQLLSKFSEEGNVAGLGWLDATTTRFRLNDIRHKIPHIGWNSVIWQKLSKIAENIPESAIFYFVHSFHVTCNNPDDVLGTSFYGYEFVSVVQKDNIYGTQFHPEKSHKTGELLLANFLNL